MNNVPTGRLSVIDEKAGFGNSSIKGVGGMNKTLNLQGTGVSGLIKESKEMLIID